MSTITLQLPTYALTGIAHYDPASCMLTLIDADTGDSEVLSLDLPDRMPARGCVFVKGYSEHAHLPEALSTAGVAEIVREHYIGRFRSRVVEMHVVIA